MSADLKSLGLLLGNAKLVSLSHTLETGMPAWPTHARYGSVLYESYDFKDAAQHSQIVMSEHSGTHIDAPLHFIKGGLPVDELPLDAVIGRGVMIDASGLAPREDFPLGGVLDFEAKNGPLEKDDIVLFRFGWEEKYRPQPNAADFLRDWPGLSGEAGEYLRQKGVKAVGTDAMSLDTFDAPDNVCHHLLLGAGIPILENVCALSALPPFFYVIGLPLPFKGGSASPLRLIALILD